MNKELPIKLEGILYTVTNDKFKFLFLRRTPEDGHFWQPLTGTLHKGESFEECLIRELKEETGITDPVEISDEIWRFDWKKGNQTIKEFVFGIKLDYTDKIKLNPKEHCAYKWCQFEEAIELLEKDNNKKAFVMFKRKVMNENKNIKVNIDE